MTSDVPATVDSALPFVVVGSDSQIGQSLVRLLNERQWPVAELSEADCQDVAQLERLLASVSYETTLVNALTEAPADSDSLNSELWLRVTKALCDCQVATGAVLLQCSDAQVFSGQSKRAYQESDDLDGSSSIAEAFKALESLVQANATRWIILRTGWVFSADRDNLLTRLVGAAVSQQTLWVSGAIRGCPTSAMSVARVLVGMTEQIQCGVEEPSLWGVYHYADSDACSLFTFAKTTITALKSMADVQVETLEEGDRPESQNEDSEVQNFELRCKHILSTFGIKQRPWRRGVHDVLKAKYTSG